MSEACTVPTPLTAETATGQRPRRQARSWIVALIVLALLVGALAFADRYLRLRAQDTFAVSLQQKMGTPDRPKIDIKDVPFLTSAAASKFHHVTLEASRLQTRVPIEYLTADIKGLKMSDNYQQAVAQEMTGQARLTWATTRKEVGFDIQYVGNDQIRVSYQFDLLATKVNAIVTASLLLDSEKQEISLGSPKIEVAGLQLPHSVTKSVFDMFVKPVPLTLPEGIKVMKMAMAQDGVTFDYIGQNVDLTNLQ